MSWFLVQTHPRAEASTCHELALLGFGTWEALCQEERRPVPKRKLTRLQRRAPVLVEQVRVRAFPGYIFVALDLARDPWRKIFATPGVVRLFGTADRPVPVPAAEMRELRKGVDRWLAAKVPSVVKPGTHLTVADGPFTSFPGIVERADGHRIWALVSIFGRSTPVELEMHQVELAA